jgi:hypothetical protein
MLEMQQDLASAKSDIEAQQKVLSSSEEFAKKVFSSRITRFFDFSAMQKDQVSVTKNTVVVPPQNGNKNTVVYVLLPEAPIDQTLELQYKIYTQPRNSYFQMKNLVIFFWGDSPDALKQAPLQISYFADSSDKDIPQSLSYHDGRVFADDQPFPKFGEPDSDFRGNKWIRLGNAPDASPKAHPTK